MKIRQHIPNFIDDINPKQNEVEISNEIFNLEWVKKWSIGEFKKIPFWRYSQSKPSMFGRDIEWTLIAEWKSENGHYWWVIGYSSESLNLPEFTGE